MMLKTLVSPIRPRFSRAQQLIQWKPPWVTFVRANGAARAFVALYFARMRRARVAFAAPVDVKPEL